jgi:zinc protease
MSISTWVHALPQIESWVTDKGANVYFVQSSEIPMIDVQVMFDAGSARDGEQSGIASLTNQMLSEGAEGKTVDEIALGFEHIGARFSNASARDMASFSLRTLSDITRRNEAFALFKQVLSNPDFPQASLERLKQHTILSIQAEKQSPTAIATRAFYSALYGEHPYATMPVGTENTASNITTEDLRHFYERFYVNKNAIVVMVGDIQQGEAIELANNLMSDLPSGHHAKPLPQVKKLTESTDKHIQYPSSQTQITLGQPGITRLDDDYFPLYVGNHILGGNGLVSLLNEEIREKRGLSYGVGSTFMPMREKGPFIINLKTRNAQSQASIDIVKSVLTDFIHDGPTEQQLKAAKQNITGGFALRLNSNSKIVSHVAMMAFYGLPLDYLNQFTSRINDVTVEQIKDAFNRHLDINKLVLITVGDHTETQTTN